MKILRVFRKWAYLPKKSNKQVKGPSQKFALFLDFNSVRMGGGWFELCSFVKKL